MKKTTAERDPEAEARLHDLVREISVAMITTVTPDGRLRSRPMVTVEFSAEGQLWFFVSDDSDKARDVAEEQGVCVNYADAGRNRYVSVSGNASIVHDPEKVHELWRPEFGTFFPLGLDDPHLALMAVRVETAEYWDAAAGGMVSLHEQPGTDRGATAHRTGEHTRVDIRATPTSG